MDYGEFKIHAFAANHESGIGEGAKLLSERVTDLEHVTHRFFIVKKEMHILAYFLRINGTLILHITLFFFL